MGKNVLLIGASGDIGGAIAESLASEGYKLILHYHKNKQAIDRYRLNLNNESILTEVQADLSVQSEVKQLLLELVFPVDAIIFASGKAHYGLFQDSDEKVMDEMLALHVKTPWLITKHLLPAMIQNKQGKIIFITSIWGEIGASNEVMYSSLKGAQNSFVKALAKEVAPSGISVNAVSPGFIDTKMNNHLLPVEKETITSDIPINRAGTADDVANAILFLINDKSSYIQGEIINVTGGW
ncbi:3-oxoacyl-[acyl-carrier protein] reductase [Virgibacillus subterraneus]|uniref:3-oxoacyl-[acyl-carrier protein] reductase n=1 Tax=Virgibacillus subterraneus TaxID=621109 RepID=A0A1H9H1X6_9BACI|nr:SDR family oxidoreductase [Virgibacillus subterraneus]SEQ56310.1 3-oxoacyl-[acyl-carrier protein] reductase [Virgibacillus subterraneus]